MDQYKLYKAGFNIKRYVYVEEHKLSLERLMLFCILEKQKPHKRENKN